MKKPPSYIIHFALCLLKYSKLVFFCFVIIALHGGSYYLHEKAKLGFV